MNFKNISVKQIESIFGKSEKIRNTEHINESIEMKIDPYEYDNEFIIYEDDDCFYYGELKKTLNYLKEQSIILSWYKNPSKENVWDNIPQEDKDIFIKEYEKSFEGINGIITILNSEVGEYRIEFNPKKLSLFTKILKKEIKYLCKLKTINYLISKSDRIDIDEFLDFMELEDLYSFKDINLLIFSIASTSRKNIAKMYHYFGNVFYSNEENEFTKGCLEFETEVLTVGNSNFDIETFTECIGNFCYDSKKDLEVQKNICLPLKIEGSISYDFETQQLIVGTRYISFKTAKTQRTLIELLINNHYRYITLSELKGLGVRNIKQTLDDIRDKMGAKGVTVLERKMLFNYFTEKGEEYCRILL